MRRERFIPETVPDDPRFTPNDGIACDPEWGWSVNYGHYGGRQDGVPVWDGAACGYRATFAVEMAGVGDEGERRARLIWSRRAEIAELVAAHADPRTRGVPTARLAIRETADGGLQIREYDLRRFTDRLPPR